MTPTEHPDGPFVEASRPAPSPALIAQRREQRLAEEAQVAEAREARRASRRRAAARRADDLARWKENGKILRRARRLDESRQRWADDLARMTRETEDLVERAAAKAGELEDRYHAAFLERVNGQRPPNDMLGWQFFAAVRPDTPAADPGDRLPFPTGNQLVN